MKSLAVLTAIIGILAGATWNASASAGASSGRHLKHAPLHLSSLRVPAISAVSARADFRPLQTTPAPTVSPTSVPTSVATSPTPTSAPPAPTSPAPSATPIPTSPPPPSPTPVGCQTCPDPVTLLNNMIAIYERITTAHFTITTDGEQTGIEKLHIAAVGDATCKGPSLIAKVSASDTVEGTQQVTKLNYQMIVIKNKGYLKKSGKHASWQPAKIANLAAFGFDVENPLICPSASGSGGGGTVSSAIKDLVNLGPTTFQGVKVWHVRATEVSTDTSSGAVQEAQLDFLISQDHFLPYDYKVTIDDPADNITLVQDQVLTKFGEKVTISAPKKGATKP